MHNNMNVNVSGPVQPTSTYKTKVLKGNHSFASQVTESNTKYVIKHNFELDGDVTIPENCILEFDGGNITEHTITFQDTLLAGTICINCEFHGKIQNDIIKDFWFPNMSNNFVRYINNMIEVCDKIELSKNYVIDGIYDSESRGYISIRDNVSIFGNNNTITLGENRYVDNKMIFQAASASNIEIADLIIDINGEHNEIEIAQTYLRCIDINNGENIYIHNVTCKNNPGRQCFFIGKNNLIKPTNNVRIENCVFHNVANFSEGGSIQTDHSSLYIVGDNIIVRNNEFINDTLNDNTVNPHCSALEIHADNCIIENNYVKNYGLGIYICAEFSSCNNFSCINNTFENITFGIRIIRSSQYFSFRNLIIDGNTIIKSNGTRACHIQCYEGNPESMYIKNNILLSTFEYVAGLHGAIYYSPTIHNAICVIENNTINDYHGCGIEINCDLTDTKDIDVKIDNNSFKNCCIDTFVEDKQHPITTRDNCVIRVSGIFLGNLSIINNNNFSIKRNNILFLCIGASAFNNVVISDNTSNDCNYLTWSPTNNIVSLTFKGKSNVPLPDLYKLNGTNILYYFNDIKIIKVVADNSSPATTKSIFYSNRAPKVTETEVDGETVLIYDFDSRHIFERGSICINRNINDYLSPVGWICLQRGNPGTWAALNGPASTLRTSGDYLHKPSGDTVPIGFNYYCNDRRSAEAAIDGIMIYYKGNDTWIDALGRVVS